MSNYLILGSGYVGNHLANTLPNAELVIRRINSKNDIAEILIPYQSTDSVVVNCIGKTGVPNVDWCESHKDETWIANVDTCRHISETCDSLDLRLVNIGTGCIFQSDKPLDDNAEPNYFGSFYSISKYAAEREVNKNIIATTLRIRMPITDTPNSKNFLNKVLRYNRIINIPNSVTFLSDLTRMVEHVVDKNIYGPVNSVHPQPLGLYKLFQIAGKDERDYDVITTEELRTMTIADRSNTLLYPKKLLDSGFEFCDFDSELERCVKGSYTRI